MERTEDEEKDHSETKTSCRPSSTDRNFGVMLFGTSITIAILAALYAFLSRSSQSFYESYIPDPSVEPEVLNLFVSYDQNLDGRIDPKEFVQIASRILATKDSVLGIPLVQENWDESGEKLTVNASFEPLILSSMTKFSDASFTVFDHPIENLKSWRQLAKPVATFPVSAFALFLPPQHLKPNEPWYIIAPAISKYGPNLSSHRYVPPPVNGNGVLIHYLLSMFHPRPFIMSRFGPQGTVASIQAYNDKYLKIAFRIHGEFQLNEQPLLPFWFSPAQFLGNIVISRDGKHIKSFHMAVPNNRSLNVDMEWILNVDHEAEQDLSKEAVNGGKPEEGERTYNMEVDIGYVRQMEINSNGPSCISNETCPNKQTEISDHDLTWELEIPQEKVEESLLKFLYPFTKVTYLPFKEAFKQAQEQNKPVHHILLWGALDDQSC